MRIRGFSRKVMGAFVCLALLLHAGPAFAQSVTLFSKVYHKERGRPVTHVDQFTVPTGVTDVKLRVANGTETAGAFKNVVIALNGVTVVGPGDLQRFQVAEEPLLQTLSPNTLEVTLRAPGGSAVEVSVVGSLVVPEPPPLPDDLPPEMLPPEMSF